MKSASLPKPIALARFSALAVITVFGGGCVTMRSESVAPADEFIGDDVIHFICLEQRQADLRPTLCRLDVDDRTVEPVLAGTEASPGGWLSIAPDRRTVAFSANVDPASFDDSFEFIVLNSSQSPHS